MLRPDDTGNLRYVAPLADVAPTPLSGAVIPPTLPFARWWTEKVLYSQGEVKFSRWDLVDQMAHKDGGAHVDQKGVAHDYAEFKLRGAGVMTIPLPPGQPELPQQISAEMMALASTPGDAASPTVWQIAWELLETLSRAGLPDGLSSA